MPLYQIEKKSSSLRQKNGGGPKQKEKKEVNGEQAAHSPGASFKVVPMPILVPLHCICF